ncbi:YcxB family protein [Flavobacterium sp.]|uniref:YcxB family protein n=1 Tax=Flavobacterium sp. TaxID=239 RepID=UPI00374DA29A
MTNSQNTQLNSQFAKINISSIDKIIETKQHFFLKFKPEVVIIPKSEIEEYNFVKNEFIKLAEKQRIKLEIRLNWKW